MTFFRPFAKCNQHETEKVVQEVLQNGVTYPDVTVLDSQSMPVLHQSMVRKPTIDLLLPLLLLTNEIVGLFFQLSVYL